LLLQIAAEVEHAFLLQYLYAAYSVNPGVPAAADAAQTLVEVAKQEMAHLATVQNVLAAIGRPVDLSREDFPAHPDQYPFPAALQPVSSRTLAKYVVAEGPPIEAITDPATLALLQRATQEADVPNIHRVGALYAALYWLFQSGDMPEGPWRLESDVVAALVRQFGAGHHVTEHDFADANAVADLAATKDEWGGDDSMHIDAATPRDRALAALATIAQQGEGPTVSVDVPSHFDVFVGLYRSFPNWPPTAVLDIPTNPHVPASGEPDGPSLITNALTATWASLLDTRYRALLLHIAIGLSTRRSVDSTLRASVIGWALAEMLGAIAPIGQNLATKLHATALDRPQFAAASSSETRFLRRGATNGKKSVRLSIAARN